MNTISDFSMTLEDVAQRYPVRISPFVETLIQNDPSGALKRQFYPCIEEIGDNKGYLDPIGDRRHAPLPGVIHRYSDRVLLLVASECFANCRFCFRKGLLAASAPFTAKLSEAISYIEQDDQIWEVILSGGDPLTLSGTKLANVISAVENIAHISVIRIHTRTPVVNPARINAHLMKIFKDCKKPIYCVLHINHPSELAPEVEKACAKLRDTGAVLLSQSVLLREVNDNVETLASLMRRLVQNRIKPYYLHNCDPAEGTAHFNVDLETGRHLVAELRRQVSGICQPTFILDIPHGYGKVTANRENVLHVDGCWEAIDAKGKKHRLWR